MVFYSLPPVFVHSSLVLFSFNFCVPFNDTSRKVGSRLYLVKDNGGGGRSHNALVLPLPAYPIQFNLKWIHCCTQGAWSGALNGCLMVKLDKIIFNKIQLALNLGGYLNWGVQKHIKKSICRFNPACECYQIHLVVL